MTPTPTMSQEELALFNELFSSRFGLHFPEHKREILESRLQPRLRAHHLQRFIDYYLLLQYDLQRELDPLTRAITNNESYFFRETGQFDALIEEVVRRRNGGTGRTTRILSAGCSAGEEPYTLNIVLRRGVPALGDDLQIEAIDLDAERLEQARTATYRPSSLRTLDADQTQRFFEHRGDDSFVLREPYRRGVQFASGNILDLSSLSLGRRFDAVFCRNVLIYFSEEALKQAVGNFADIVQPGGLLFLGHSESIIGLTQSFQAERLGQCIAYRRKSES
ncbi:MAG: protein-glutamate O-methyltransferase CheR [Acidobacteriota bacterium]